MKRKIFSTLLMGAFFIASMSMFTSCKDYDDDINANSDEIAALKTQLTTLQTTLKSVQDAAATYESKTDHDADIASLSGQIANLVTAEKLQSAIDDINKLLAGKASQADLETLQAKINAIDPELNTLKTKVADLESAKENINSQLQVLTELASKMDATKIQSTIDAIKAIQDGLGTGDDTAALKEKMAQISKLVDALSANGNIITNFVTRQLASLTFVPRLFVGGIETASVPALQGKFLTTPKDYKYTTTNTAATKDSIISGIGVAEYHVSPTTANLVGSTTGFYSLVADVRSGANLIAPTDYAKSLTQEVVDSLYDKAEGILKVPFKADWTTINKKVDKGQAVIAALQVSRTDTTITSDYAQFVATKYTDLKLADIFDPKGKTTACGISGVASTTKHIATLWDKVSATDGSDYTHAVAYNGSLNLDSIVKTHGTVTADGASNEIQLTDAELQALGLHYQYTIVPWTIGTNGTDEAAHLQITNGVAYPRDVTADGKRIDDKVASPASVGRTPVVLVELVDASGKVFAEGYIKIKISTVAEALNAQVAPALDMTNDIYAGCEDANGKLTWSTVEYNIYNNLLSISKAQFENNYEFYTDSLFITKDEKKFVAVAQSDSLGTVAEVKDANDPTTNILQWTLTGAQLDKLRSVLDTNNDGTSDVALKVYAYYKKKNETSKTGVFVPLQYAAGKIHYAVGTIGGKVLGYWYGLNSSSAGDQEVRVNVPVPTAKDSLLESTEFTKNLNEYFTSNAVKVNGIDTAKFKSFKDAQIEYQLTTPAVAKGNATFNATKDNTWTVNSISGTTYTLKLADANTIQVVKAGKEAITPVDLITLNGSKITYVEGTVQDDILNYVDHNALGELETLTAYIQVGVKTACGTYAQITNPYFNVRFLRPVNLSPANGVTIEDAPNNGMDIALAKLVTVTDWRDYVGYPHGDSRLNTKWASDPTVKQFAYYYYQLKIVTDVDAIYTDIAQSESVRNADPLTSASAIEKLNKTTEISGIDITKVNDATLHYTNNGANVQKFHLYVPVSVEYVFGKPSVQKTYAVITVQKTVQNAK